MRRACYIVVLLAVAPWALASPGEAVAAALADARTLDAGAAYYTRYLDLSNVREADREPLRQAVAFWVNSLSREATIVRPRDVTPTLLALDVRDYGWNAKTLYEFFADARAGEPYFHVTVEVKGAGKASRTTAAAPWVGPPAGITELVKLTGSYAPVIRADWFVYQTAVSADRLLGYYVWLGLGNKEADFQKLIGANVAEARRVKKEMAAVVARSGVTLNNRSIARVPSLTGGYWFTQDFKASKDKQNTVRLLDFTTEPPHGDASEQYGVLPNGLFAFWLQNDKGERQDTAPDFIASDGQSTSTDRRVHVGMSCVRCHAEGIRPIDDHARKLFRGDVKLVSPDYDKLVRLRQLYLSDLPRQVARDQGDYAEALRAANGLAPAVNARVFAKVWADYEADLGVDDVARELGTTADRLRQALANYGPTLDPVLAGLVQMPPLPLRREHFEEVVHLAYAALGNKVP
jgi:hypothetical protein